MLNKEKIWTKSYVVLCMSSFFMFLTVYILSTAFPLYTKDILGGNQQQMGLAISIYILGGVLFRPFSGGLTDRFGVKKMAIVGMAGFLIACILYWGAKGMFVFFLIRLLHGMGYALASTAGSAAVSKVVPYSRAGEGIGYYSMFMSIGMVIGPALGLILWENKNVSLLLSVVCVVAAIALLFTLGMKTPQPSKEAAVTPQPAIQPVSKRKGLHWRDFIDPKAMPISLAGFILAFSYSSVPVFISSYTNEIHQSSVTSYFFVVLAIMIVLFRPVTGKIFDKYNEHWLAYPGIAFYAIGVIVLSQAYSSTMIILAAVLMGIGYGALLPCFQTLAMKQAPEHRRGVATGTFFLLFDFGYGLGSYLLGLVAMLTNFRIMYELAGGLTLLSVAVYYLFHHRPQVKLPVPNQKANIT